MTRTTRSRTRLTAALGALVASTLALTLGSAPADADATATATATTTTTAAAATTAAPSLRANPTVYVNQPLTISGKVPGKKRKLQLQKKSGPTWVKAGKGKSDKKGRYTISVPTDVYGRHKVRVVAKRVKGKRAVTGKAKKYTVIPVYTPIGAASSYVLYDSANKTRWNSCTPITWAYNSGGTDAAHRAVVDVAMAEVSRATGWRFKYVGETTKVPFTYNVQSQQSEPANVIIAWTTPAVVPALNGNVLGYGGSTYGLRKRNGVGEYTNGGISLDLTDGPLGPFVEYTDGSTWGWGALVRHELGHVVGLDHTNDPSQEMYPAVSGLNERYGVGDLRGLALASKSRGCSSKPIRKQIGAGTGPVVPSRESTAGLIPFQGTGPIE